MAANDSNVVFMNRDVELVSLKLAAIDSQVDCLAMLAITGDLSSLKPGVLTGSLIDIGERLTEAKRFLDDLHSSALKVVGGKARHA